MYDGLEEVVRCSHSAAQDPGKSVHALRERQRSIPHLVSSVGSANRRHFEHRLLLPFDTMNLRPRKRHATFRMGAWISFTDRSTEIRCTANRKQANGPIRTQSK